MSTIDRVALLQKNTSLVGYRLVTEHDIQPGAELYMAHVGLDERAEFRQCIRMDDEPLGQHRGEACVFYHCLGFPNLQCFVSVITFAKQEVPPDLCGPYCTTLYLAKTD